jgi:hypothetical protein
VIDDRAVSAVVEKTLELGLITLYVTLVTTTLLAGTVPQAETETGDAIAERTVAAAAERIEQAVPPTATAVTVRERVSLPATIRGTAYDLRADGERLVLVHPDQGIAAEATLTLPDRVTAVEGRWESGGETVIAVDRSPSGLVVRLREDSR